MSDIIKLFGSSGIRGSAEDFFTNQASFDLGRAFALLLKENGLKGKLAIGRDPRDSSPRIKNAVASGFLSEGFEVYDMGIVPIPAVNRILKDDGEFAGSVMITGSHIKAHLNGLKFFAFGEEILKEHERRIEEIYSQNKDKIPFEDQSDQLKIIENPDNGYKNYLKSIATTYPKWKILVDAGNGAQSKTFPVLLEELNLNVIRLNDSITENFLSRDTEVEADFIDLCDKVKEEKADFGIGFDSDGDRVVFIDENGSFVTGDYIGTLISREIDNPHLVTPVNTSQIVDHIGKIVHRTKVGSPYVVQKMKEVGAAFGFEANGGGIYKEMMSRDGGRSAIQLMNILAQKKLKLSELLAELPKFYIARDKIDYEWELKEEIENKVKEKFKGSKIEEIDGIKIWIDDTTWILYRSSMNAPEFRVFVETESKEKSEQMLKDGLDFVKEIIEMNKLSL